MSLRAHECLCVCLNFNIAASIESILNSFTNQCVYASLGLRDFEYHGFHLEPVALVEYQYPSE